MVEIVRVKQRGISTLSQLYIDGIFECWFLEDAVRNVKIDGHTCIPPGEYSMKFNTSGGMNEKYKKYKNHKGMIEISGIPNYSNVYIHKGNRVADTKGCPLTGDFWAAEAKDFIVMNSASAYEKLYPILADRIIKGESKIVVRNLNSIKPLDFVPK